MVLYQKPLQRQNDVQTGISRLCVGADVIMDRIFVDVYKNITGENSEPVQETLLMLSFFCFTFLLLSI